jgi:hypothetical protein
MFRFIVFTESHGTTTVCMRENAIGHTDMSCMRMLLDKPEPFWLKHQANVANQTAKPASSCMSWPCFVCWGEYHGSGYCQNYPACRRSQVQSRSEALAIGSLTWHQPPGTPPLGLPPASAALVAHPAVVVQPAACSTAAQAAISAWVPALVGVEGQGSCPLPPAEPKKRPRQLPPVSKSTSKANASRSSGPPPACKSSAGRRSPW